MEAHADTLLAALDGRLTEAHRRELARAYRSWLGRNLDRLLDGEPAFWSAFQRVRSRMLLDSTGSGLRARWEEPFTRPPPRSLPSTRLDVCAHAGISRTTLSRLRRAGLLAYPPPAPPPYAPEHLKWLQWVLFFTREVGLSHACLRALLSLEDVHRRLVLLCRAAPLHHPVHRSPPSAQAPGLSTRPDEGILQEVERLDGLIHKMGNRIQIIGGRAGRLHRIKGETCPVTHRNLSIVLAEVGETEDLLEQLRAVAATLRARGNLSPSHRKTSA